MPAQKSSSARLVAIKAKVGKGYCSSIGNSVRDLTTVSPKQTMAGDFEVCGGLLRELLSRMAADQGRGALETLSNLRQAKVRISTESITLLE
jgi:hypothetical protein